MSKIENMLIELRSMKRIYQDSDPIQQTFIQALFEESILSLEKLSLGIHGQTCRRKSNLKFQIVNVGIDLCESGNHDDAENFLRLNGISESTIKRVLACGASRR